MSVWSLPPKSAIQTPIKAILAASGRPPIGEGEERSIARQSLSKACHVIAQEKGLSRLQSNQTSIIISVLSCDYEIAWDPYCRDAPIASKSWVFATPSTPHFIASEMMVNREEEIRVVVLHSKSQSASKSVEEIRNTILEYDDANENSIAAVLGGGISDVVVAVASNLQSLFPSIIFSKVSLKNLYFRVCPGIYEISKAYEYVERQAVISSSSNQQPSPSHLVSETPQTRLCRVKSCMQMFWAADDEKIASVKGISEMHFEAMAQEVGSAIEMASRNIAETEARVIIMTGMVGYHLDEAVKRIRKACELNGREYFEINERATSRLRAGVLSEKNKFLKACSNRGGPLIVIAAPNLRRNDRTFFIHLCRLNGISCIIAWMTRPNWWHNCYISEDPLPWISLRQATLQFQSPDRDLDGVPVVRVV
jgi:hypothetical protein